MQHRPDRRAVRAVMADRPVAEERAIGTCQTVIVNGRDDRDPGVPAGMQDGSAKQREGVVDMDDLGLVRTQHGLHVMEGLPAPDAPGGNGCLLQQGPLADLVALAGKQPDLMPTGRECLALLVDDPVLAAWRGGTVAVMGKQDPHPAGSPHVIGRRGMRGVPAWQRLAAAAPRDKLENLPGSCDTRLGRRYPDELADR